MRPTRSGILIVDKPAGATSFYMVGVLRRRLGVRRIGHAGTLDPAAVGVLPLLIGEATKLVPYLFDEDKEYVATIRFGVTTDSHDLTGRVISTAPVPPLTRDSLLVATRPFVGVIRQVPPMFSALHYEGRRLYDLARQGLEVAREAREVRVHSIDVEGVSEATATVRIVCGRGTYVRVLAADLGAALGCGGAVERLVRTRVGPFDRGQAIPASDIAAAEAEAVWARTLPPEAALRRFGAVRLEAGLAVAFVHGQPVRIATSCTLPPGLVRVHDEGGTLLGVGEGIEGGQIVRPLRILHADLPGTRVLPV